MDSVKAATESPEVAGRNGDGRTFADRRSAALEEIQAVCERHSVSIFPHVRTEPFGRFGQGLNAVAVWQLVDSREVLTDE